MQRLVQYVVSLRNNFSGPLQQANNSVNQFNNNVNRLQNNTSRLGGGFSSMAGLATRAFGAIAVGAAIGGIAKMGMDMEQTRIQFKTFLGDAEKGNQVIKDLQKFSLATPFDDAQVLSAGKSLLAFGVQAGDLENTLTKLGNISSATGKDFNELATMYGKNKIAGVLMAEDLNQLTEAGIPALEEIGKVMGVPAAQVKKLGSEGKITFDVFDKAMNNLGGSTGKWGKLMDEQSKTVAGRLSSLQGFAQNLGSQLGEMMLPFMGSVVDGGNTILTFIQTNKAKIGEMFGPLRKAIQPLIDSFQNIRDRMGDSGSILEKVFNGIATGIKLVSPFISVLASTIGFVYERIADVVGALVNFGQKNEWVGNTLRFFYKTALVAFTQIADIAKNIFGGVADLIQGVFNPDISKGSKQFKQGLGKLKDGLLGTDENNKKYQAIMNGEVSGVSLFGKDENQKDLLSNTNSSNGTGTGAGATGAGAAASKALSTDISGVKSSKPTVINVNIGKQVETIQINTTNLKESASEVERIIKEYLIRGVADVAQMS